MTRSSCAGKGITVSIVCHMVPTILELLFWHVLQTWLRSYVLPNELQEAYVSSGLFFLVPFLNPFQNLVVEIIWTVFGRRLVSSCLCLLLFLPQYVQMMNDKHPNNVHNKQQLKTTNPNNLTNTVMIYVATQNHKVQRTKRMLQQATGLLYKVVQAC